MKDIKYIGLFIVMLCQFGFSVYGVTTKGLDQLGGEKLKYVVTYKWGLINKEAGDAILTLNDRGNYYDIKMTAKSHPWADKVFMVRDTLVTKVRKEGFKPEQYHKAAHEGGKYSLDIVDFRYEGSKVKGHCERIRDKKGKERDHSSIELESVGPTFDMLSVFYYLRTLDFDHLATGKPLEMTVFSGSKAETMTVKKYGKEKVKLKDGSEQEALHITFKFTQGGKQRSSDDIDCWLSLDGRNIPLLVVGKLPIGQIRCYLV